MPSFVPTPEPGRQSPPAPQPPPAVDPLLIPVLADKRANSWPLYPQGQPALYLPLAEAFGRLYATDAHFAAYSVPQLLRRLAKDEALLRLAEQGGVPMVLFVTDVDAPGHVATEAWWQAEQAKLLALAQEHPGLFAYRTRGGYRIVYVLAVPVVLRSVADKEAWKRRYWRWCLYLSRRFAIVADPSCADWTRLYRLPHVTREPGGEPDRLPWVGDPHAIGLWTVEATEGDLGADLLEAHRLVERTRPANPTQPSPWAGVGRALMGAPGASTLALPDAAEARPEPPSCTPTPAVAAEPVSGVRPSLLERQRRWCQVLLDKLCAELASAPPGDRNNALNRAAMLAGHYVPTYLQQGEVERRLTAAAAGAGLPSAEIAATLRSGLLAGMREPKEPTLPTDRPTPAARADRGAQPPVSQERPRLHQQGTQDRLAPLDRPTIEVTTELHENVAQAVAVLASVPGLYQRDGRLVVVARTTAEDELSDPRSPVVRALGKPSLRVRLSELAQFVRYDRRTGGIVPTLPSAPIVDAVYEHGDWPGVPLLIGVLETPFLRPDGTVHQTRGYDRKTGYELVSALAASVPEHPTWDDARAALSLLRDPFCDFPFAGHVDVDVALAALLSVLARPALGAANVPAFVFDANTRGTGKSLITDVVALIATGRVAPKTSYPADDEEMGKLLGGVALAGRPLLAFDNVTTLFGGSELDKVLTCEGSTAFRILGRTEHLECLWRTVTFASGNNVAVRGDSGRRVLLCRQETDEERPETREGFKYPNLRDHVREHRGELVAAGLTLLRAHALARPAPKVKPLGGFERWCRVVADALVWAGGADVTQALAANQAGNDPATDALRALLAGLAGLYPKGTEFTARQLLTRLWPPKPLAEPDGLDDLREAIEALAGGRGDTGPDSRRLGYVLRANRRRPVGGLKLDGIEGKNATRWRVIGSAMGGGSKSRGG